MLHVMILLLVSSCIALCSEMYREHYLINAAKSWDEAQSYCRETYTDLATIRSHHDMSTIGNVAQASGVTTEIWIGLRKSSVQQMSNENEWEWSDQSDSSFRYWESSQPNGDGSCVLYSASHKTWYDRGCSVSLPFFCYKDVEKRNKKIVRLEVTSNSFLDFSDSAVNEAILKQVQHKYEGVELQWNVQPDGKIFLKKIKEENQQPLLE